MSLYNYVVYVVYQLIGPLTRPGVTGAMTLYPSSEMTAFNPAMNDGFISLRGGYLMDKWVTLLQSDFDQNFWWKFLSDPKLVISTIVWLVCTWITVELCLILPFRWFKRLVRYPNHKLMTPQEVKRSKLK